MKTRLTAKSVLLSVCLVVIIAVAVVLILGSAFNEKISGYVISSLNFLPSGIRGGFESMERTFLKRVKLNGVFIDVGDQRLLYAESIDVSASLADIVKRVFSGTDVFDISVLRPVICVNTEQIDTLSQMLGQREAAAGNPPEIGIRLWITDGLVSVEYNSVAAAVSGTDCVVSLLPGFVFDSVTLNAVDTSFAYSEIPVSLKQLKLLFDSTSALSASAEEITTPYATAQTAYISASIESLLKKTEIESSAYIVADRIKTGNADASFSVSRAVVSAALNPLSKQISGAVRLTDLFASNSDLMAYISDASADFVSDTDFTSVEAGLSASSVISEGGIKGFTGIRIDNPVAYVTYSDAGIGGDFVFGLSADSDIKALQRLALNCSGSVFYASPADLQGSLNIERMNIATWPETIAMNASVSKSEKEGTDISLNIRSSDDIELFVSGNLEENLFDASLSLNAVNPMEFGYFYDNYLGFLSPVVTGDTQLDCYILTDFSVPETISPEALSFDLNMDLAVREVEFLGSRRAFTGSFLGTFSDSVFDVDRLTVSYGDYRMDYEGSIDSEIINAGEKKTIMLPTGTFSFLSAKDASLIASADLNPQGEGKYDYGIKIVDFPDLTMSGNITEESFLHYTTESFIDNSVFSYNVSGDFNIPELSFSLNCGDSFASLSIVESKISGALELSDFNIGFTSGNSFRFDLGLECGFRTDSNLFSIDVSRADISGSLPFPLSFTLHMDNDSLLINKIALGNVSPLMGMISVDFTDIESILAGDFGNSLISVNLYSDDGETVDLLLYDNLYWLEVAGFNLSRLTAGEIRSEVSLQGRFGENGYGNAALYSADGKSISCDLLVSRDSVSVENIENSFSDLRIKDTGLVFDMAKEKIDFTFDASLFREFVNSEYTYRLGGQLEIGISSVIGKFEEIVSALNESALSVLDTLNFSGILSGMPLKLTLNDISLGEGFDFKPDTLDISFDGKYVEGSGKYIDFSYNPQSREIALKLDREFGIGVSVAGTIDEQVSLTISDLYVPMPLLKNLTGLPTIIFEEGILEGTLYVYGNLEGMDLHIYGNTRCDKMVITNLWMPGLDLILSSAVISVYDNVLYIPLQRLEIADRESLKRWFVDFSFNGYIQDFSDVRYVVNFDFLDNFIPVWVPQKSLGMNIWAGLGGTLTFDGNFSSAQISGDFIFRDLNVDFNFNETTAPAWIFGMDFPTAIYADITFDTDNRIVYPDENDPFFNVTIQQGNKLSVAVPFEENEPMVINGELSLSSGHIYFIQKDFILQTGKVVFDSSKSLLNDEGLGINLNFVAMLRDFDADGNKTEIYLNLQTSSLSDINPYFTSSTNLSQDEIAEILGQSILPGQGLSGSGISSVASLTVAATETATKLGILSSLSPRQGFDSLVVDALHLDLFSIHTNILQNIVMNVIPGSEPEGYSPLARFLDGTTLFVGKYIGDSLYFRAALSLRAQSQNSELVGFIVSDLATDMEFSLDIETAPATVTVFAQPQELSVFDLLDNIGFSVTKSFQF